MSVSILFDFSLARASARMLIKTKANDEAPQRKGLYPCLSPSVYPHDGCIWVKLAQNS